MCPMRSASTAPRAFTAVEFAAAYARVLFAIFFLEVASASPVSPRRFASPPASSSSSSSSSSRATALRRGCARRGPGGWTGGPGPPAREPGRPREEGHHLSPRLSRERRGDARRGGRRLRTVEARAGGVDPRRRPQTPRRASRARKPPRDTTSEPAEGGGGGGSPPSVGGSEKSFPPAVSGSLERDGKVNGQFGATPPVSAVARAGLGGWEPRAPTRAATRSRDGANTWRSRGERTRRRRRSDSASPQPPPTHPTHAPRAARDFRPCAEKRPVASRNPPTAPPRPPRLLPSPTLIDPTLVPRATQGALLHDTHADHPPPGALLRQQGRVHLRRAPRRGRHHPQIDRGSHAQAHDPPRQARPDDRRMEVRARRGARQARAPCRTRGHRRGRARAAPGVHRARRGGGQQRRPSPAESADPAPQRPAQGTAAEQARRRRGRGLYRASGAVARIGERGGGPGTDIGRVVKVAHARNSGSKRKRRSKTRGDEHGGQASRGGARGEATGLRRRVHAVAHQGPERGRGGQRDGAAAHLAARRAWRLAAFGGFVTKGADPPKAARDSDATGRGRDEARGDGARGDGQAGDGVRSKLRRRRRRGWLRRARAIGGGGGRRAPRILLGDGSERRARPSSAPASRAAAAPTPRGPLTRPSGSRPRSASPARTAPAPRKSAPLGRRPRE